METNLRLMLATLGTVSVANNVPEVGPIFMGSQLAVGKNCGVQHTPRFGRQRALRRLNGCLVN
jgi:hypothetical protein